MEDASMSEEHSILFFIAYFLPKNLGIIIFDLIG